MTFTQLNVAAGLLQAESVPNDGKGSTSLNPYFAPLKEVVIGGLATLIVFALLWKYAWPAISKGMQDRTARIQSELDSSAADRKQAESDAAEIRTSLGDIDGERTRLFADAEAQAAALLEDGRARLDQEVAEMESKGEADIAAAAGRGADDLRADIARYSSQAIESSVTTSLDDATQQELIEGFISRVGAGKAVTS
ncbi:MAG: ATP synthase F0 subunit B [Ilumatobacter sp.]|uniref:F0F1 ATP synthase subunit B family protein n=1 Tax=Ilumatobacter sp. TaxID=1967498 RepID=UPI003C764A1E